jgi:hypothetical protein
MIAEQRDVIDTFSQRRYENIDRLQAIIEITAKLLLFNGLLEVAVGCGHYLNINRDLLGGAKASKSSRLEEPQKLYLHVQRQFADLIEKEHSAVGLFESADGCLLRIREGAARIPEQLRLDQLSRERRESNKWALAAPAARMNSARDQLFAGTGFAANQYGTVTILSDAIDQLSHVLDLRIVTDHLPRFKALEVFFERGKVTFESRHLNRILKYLAELSNVQSGLLNEIRRSQFPCLNRHIDVTVVGHHYDRQIRLYLLDCFQQHQSVLIGGAFVFEPYVEQDDIQAAIQHFLCFFSGSGKGNRKLRIESFL